MYQYIHIELRDSICTLTIAREEKLNALNRDLISEMHRFFTHAKNDKQIRVLILTGAGEKSFVAGADIAEFQILNQKTAEEFAKNNQEQLFNLIEHLGKPVIAAINGFALGGGLELAMACHIRVASENAKMGQPEVTLGIIPCYGGTQRLTQLVGKGKAIEIITTAEMITAQEAYRIGLVNHVVATQELLSKCQSIAEKIVSRAPLAIEYALEAINAQGKNNNDFSAELQAFGKCVATSDMKEGVNAFLEKRKPKFQGE